MNAVLPLLLLSTMFFPKLRSLALTLLFAVASKAAEETTFRNEYKVRGDCGFQRTPSMTIVANRTHSFLSLQTSKLGPGGSQSPKLKLFPTSIHLPRPRRSSRQLFVGQRARRLVLDTLTQSAPPAVLRQLLGAWRPQCLGRSHQSSSECHGR